MTLRLPDQWVWDFWLARDGVDYHIFYLQAPRSLEDEVLRHWHVSIGHAVSQNLREWEVLPDALRPSAEPAWDDYTTWTGSVLRFAGLWYMFYTGTCHAEEGLVQRVGLATSTNLIAWDKHPRNPLIEADPRWYELLDLDLWHDQAWRDPYVFLHPERGDFHALITARANAGPADGRGVIGHARSNDLIDWEVLPPLTEPGDFGQMEVPQLVALGGRYYLLFSSQATVHSAQRRDRTGRRPMMGTHYMVSDSPLGPFRFTTDAFLVGDPVGRLYSGKLVEDPDGTWCFLAFRNFAADGQFAGEIIDPLPVRVDGGGRLVVEGDDG